MAKEMIFMVLGNFLFAWVFAHNMAAWNPVTWGLPPSRYQHGQMPLWLHSLFGCVYIYQWTLEQLLGSRNHENFSESIQGIIS